MPITANTPAQQATAALAVLQELIDDAHENGTLPDPSVLGLPADFDLYTLINMTINHDEMQSIAEASAEAYADVIG